MAREPVDQAQRQPPGIAHLVEQERTIQVLQAQLAAITGSPVWQMAQGLVRLRTVVAPPNTWRDNLVSLVMQALVVSRQEGLWAVFRRGKNLLRAWSARGTVPMPAAPAPITYQAWIADNEPGPAELARQKQAASALSSTPSITILIAVDNPLPQHLQAAVESVVAQTYANWELYLMDGQPGQPEVKELLAELARQDQRIRLDSRADPLTSPGDSPMAGWAGTGEFVVVLGETDRLAPNLLFEVAQRLNRASDADIVYADEDQLSQVGDERCEPWFKPDWSPELLLSVNYLAHAVIRRRLLDELGGLVLEAPGGLAWEVVFRCVEQTRHIEHIPLVLYHVRRQTQPAREQAAQPEAHLRAVQAHLSRLGIQQPQVSFSGPGGQLRVEWPVRGAKVSIIIPTRDKVRFLKKCLTSVLDLTHYPDFEVLIVDNNSREARTLSYYAALRNEPRVRLLDYPGEFNFSAANNFGARHARGEILLFLNNDTEALEPGWLEELVRWAERPEVGVVGAKLLYPDGTIQHAGVIIGLEGHASHVFWGVPEDHFGPFGSAAWYRDYMAVTGACLMLRREVFDEIGGFDEAYRLVFSDMEIGLRAVSRGYRVVYTPFARLRHYEGRSRANYMPAEDIERGYDHVRALVESGDPYFNPNLSYAAHVPMLAGPGEEDRVERLRWIVEAAHRARGFIVEDLPYQQVLSDAAAMGKVLHRADIYGSGPPNTTANPDVLAMILRFGQAPVLDVGCGTGVYVAALEAHGLPACGLEVNTDYVATAQRLNRNVQMYNGRTFPFVDNEFDTAIAIEVLEHIPSWEDTLREMLRVARRCVLISVPNIGVIPSMSRYHVVPWHLLEATHVNFFTAQILSNHLKDIPGLTSQVFTYGAFRVNGETYHNHVFAVIHKTLGGTVEK